MQILLFFCKILRNRFPSFKISGIYISIKEHPPNTCLISDHPHACGENGYRAAKEQGNDVPGRKIAFDILSKPEMQKKIAGFRKRLNPEKKTVFVPVLNFENEEKLNALPLVLAEKLKELIPNSEVSWDIVKGNVRANTGAPLDERLSKTIDFVGELKDKDAQVLIVDDNFTSGDTVLSLYQHLVETGNADIRGVICFSSSKYGAGIKIRQSTIDKLQSKTKLTSEEIREIIGREAEYLTESEANAILYGPAGDARIRSIYSKTQEGRPGGRNENQGVEQGQSSQDSSQVNFLSAPISGSRYCGKTLSKPVSSLTA